MKGVQIFEDSERGEGQFAPAQGGGKRSSANEHTRR